MAMLGLVACASRSFDESSMDMDWHWDIAESHEYGAMHFDLPLTGAGRFNFGMATAQSQSGAIAEPAPVNDSFFAPEPQSANDVEWEDIAGSGERHVIQSASVELDTEYFDDVMEELRQLPVSVNGFIESSMTTAHGRRRFTIVMRVPAASFDTVLRQVEGMAYVRFSNQWAQDVTDRFYDMVGSYQIRRLEEERILALIDEADTVHELLALEQRLSNVRLSIEMYLSQLNNMAGQIAYSAITVTLIDVSEEPVIITGPTLGERIGGAFGDSVDGTVGAVQNFIVFLAAVVVPLMMIIVMVVVVYLVVRGRKKRRAAL